MTKFVLIFSFHLFVLNNFAFSQSSTSIVWGTPISFDDFQAAPDANDSAAARISVSIGLYQWKSDGKLMFSIKAFMEKSESWMKEQFRDEATLRHEQGHFDIAQIFALKLSTALKSKNYKTVPQDYEQVKKLYDSYFNEMNRRQNRYDIETHGGLRKVVQEEWLAKIKNELELVSAK